MRPVGGLLAQWLGWRAALLALTVYATATLALVALRMPETIAHKTPRPCNPARCCTWRLVLGHPSFWAFTLLTTATYGGLFTFLAASSFVFIEVLQLTRTQYGWVMLSTSVAYFCGTFVCRYLLARLGLRRSVAIAGALSLAGGTGLALVALADSQNPVALLAPFYLFMVAHGIHQPAGKQARWRRFRKRLAWHRP